MVAPQHPIRLERPILALAFPAPAQLLRLALPFHRLLAGNAALAVELGMTASGAEGLAQILDRR